MRMRESNLNVGQRFRSHYGLVWEIRDFPKTTDRNRHVRLFGVWDPLAIKIVSVSALVDRNLFEYTGMRDDA